MVTITIKLDLDASLVQGEHARYRRLACPLRLVQCSRNRVRVVRSGVWSKSLYVTPEGLAADMLRAAETAQLRADQASGATVVYYTDTAAFWRAAAVAVASDTRIRALWGRPC